MTISVTTAMTRLGLDLPVVLGPFGGGLSTTTLTATVSNSGGLGSFGAHSFAPARIEALADEIRAQTSRAFAINLWVSDHDSGGIDVSRSEFERAWKLFEPWFRELGVDKPEPQARYHPSFSEQVDALIEARPPVFSFVFGIPEAKILAACRSRDITTIGAATSIAEAQALEGAGVNMIVASGFEAGGHRPSFLARAEDSLMGTFALTQLVARHVTVPVIAAGGIADAHGVQAALTLGAQAVQIGTAFLACEESGTHALHRHALRGDGAYQTTLTRAFSGRLARGLRNRWTDHWAGHANEIAPFPLQSWFTSQLRAAALAAGRTDVISLWSGQIAPKLQHRHAADLIESLRTGLALAPPID